MTASRSKQPNPQANGLDIIAILAARLTDAELHALQEENARYVAAKNKRNIAAQAADLAHTKGRSLPKFFRQSQTAINTQDTSATDTAWHRCKNWMLADAADFSALSAANKTCAPRGHSAVETHATHGPWLHLRTLSNGKRSS